MKKHFFALVRKACSEKLIFLILISLGLSTASYAEKRGRVIDFEDELVEGVNKRPLDSLSQISERGKNGRKAHLYRKRGSFRNETQETLMEVRVWQ
jgi:hypothetical protein